jgi:hypothetical protein
MRFNGLIFAACAVLAGHALGLEGSGFGRSVDEARQRAAADLAGAIQVQVKSVVEACTQVKGRKAEDCGSRVVNRTATDLPLLGLTYDKIPGGSEAHGARAMLDAGAIPLYEQQLARWKKEYAAQAEAFRGAKDRQQKHAVLSRQLMALRAYQDHRLVATALGAKIEDAPGSEAALMAEREKLEDRADAMPFAARLLMKDLAGSIVRAEPLRAAGSREATPFGAAMVDALRVEMTGRAGPPMRLAGEYRVLDNGDLDLVLEIRDGSPEGSGELAGVRSVRLAKAGYEGYRAVPLAPNFEQLLKSGEAVSGGLRAEVVTTAGGSGSALLFRNGETLKLAARVNRAAYFYIVGHVIQADKQFSYLLPVQDGAEGPARFVRRVPADLANHYVEIGEFAVEPPFGAEHLQIVASTQDLATSLPPHEYDGKSGYFLIKASQGNALKGLQGTRGLRPKPTVERQVAEDTLTFTTSGK